MTNYVLKADGLNIGVGAPTKPKRKPSLTKAARLAKKEGVQVKIATDGSYTVTPVKPIDDITPSNTETEGNEWDRLQ